MTLKDALVVKVTCQYTAKVIETGIQLEMELKCSCQVLDVTPKGWKSVSQFVFSVVLLGVALERCAK